MTQREQDVPERDFRAFRRVVDGVVHLEKENQFFELDDLLDRIWRAVDGRRNVAAVAQTAMAGLSMSPDEALETTLIGLDQLVEIEVLVWGKPKT
jgi:hypothetical protein